MTLLTANLEAVSSGTITLPRIGRGVMDLRLAIPRRDSRIKPLDKVELVFSSGESFKTTCLRAGPDGGFWRVLLVAGAGKMNEVEIKPKFYSIARMLTPITDAIRESGEAVGKVEISDPTPLRNWVRPQTTLSRELRALMLGFVSRPVLKSGPPLDNSDYFYRIDAAGLVNVGLEVWPEGGKYEVLEDGADTGLWTVPLSPGLEPGKTLILERDGQTVTVRVDRVEHYIGAHLRTRISVHQPEVTTWT